MASGIPDSHRDLVSDENAVLAILATTMADGTPQATPVWFDMEGEIFRVNTVRGRVKERNMIARPHVALTMFDPDDYYRYMMIRGRIVGDSEEGARDHINRLNQKYRGSPNYPFREGETRVIFRMRPISIVAR
jgi:PPOX class probable F420-dependent enzyme